MGNRLHARPKKVAKFLVSLSTLQYLLERELGVVREYYNSCYFSF